MILRFIETLIRKKRFTDTRHTIAEAELLTDLEAVTTRVDSPPGILSVASFPSLSVHNA